MPTVSIIVPVYNTAEYLPACIDSLLEQTLTDVEIICVDDGSTDGSWEILQTYAKKDSRVRVFRQKNAGPGRARNLALSHARGGHIMFCDSDDWYAPAMCEKMHAAIIRSQADLACCDCVIEYDKNAFGRDEHALDWHYLKFEGPLNLSSQNKNKINYILWNKIFRKDLIETHRISFPNIREHDDDSFITQYLYAAHTAYGLAEKLYHYRLRENSIMSLWHLTPSKANKWDHLASWRHTGLFLLRQPGKNPLPAEYLAQFYEVLSLMRRHFKWEELSSQDAARLQELLAELPFNPAVPLQRPFYEAQHGRPELLWEKTSTTKKTLRCFKMLCYKYESNWKEERLYICGIEMYKKSFLTNKLRVLGLLSIPTGETL